VKEADGGAGLGYLAHVIAIEEISRASARVGLSYGAHSNLCITQIARWGTADQKARYLPKLISGEHVGSLAMSESGAGSDVMSMKLKADAVQGGYVLNGTKFWITHGGVADIYIVMARSGGPGPGGISAFLVPAGTPGLSFGKKEEKMGLRASPTVEMVLEGARIPAANRIGEEGLGFRVAMSALDSGRITIGATSVGLGQSAMEAATAYACERQQFEQAIINFQGVAFMLADMATRVTAARLLVHEAARLKDAGRAFSAMAAMAKLVATDNAMAVTTDAVQVFGGYGYTREYPVERMMRDAKVMQIVEGTNQVQRVVVARHLKRAYGRS
jgi:alkylation response protein AidB-like acyl-CoA dehydrogenase